jgi:glycosyltransferase involved in cell wall biosynthesis
MTPVSVIICTRNPGSDSLGRVLGSLKTQTLELKNWELLLIDNASDRVLADSWNLAWHPHARHVRENATGLTRARLRGIQETSSSLIVFIDDDNVLAPDFLEQALALMDRHPYLGVWGAGVLEPEFEAAPPPELASRLHMLALRSVSTAVWSSNPQDHTCIPWGAGLCVRRCVAQEYERLIARLNVTELVDRRGSQLFAGGDDLFSWAATSLGLGFGIFPELQIRHLIPLVRLRRSYFIKLTHDHAFSHGVLRYLLLGKEPHRADAYWYLRILLHWIRHGRYSAQCQLAVTRGNNAARRFITECGVRPMEARLRTETTTPGECGREARR